MVSITLSGIITSDKKLLVDLPSELPAGPVEIEIRSAQVEGITLKEILDSDLVGIWAERDNIDNAIEFAEKLRHQASRRSSE